MRIQQSTLTSVRENDFNLGLCWWSYFISYYFVLNRTNYKRYGSYYLQVTEAIDSTHPGLKQNNENERPISPGLRLVCSLYCHQSIREANTELRCKKGRWDKEICYAQGNCMEMASQWKHKSTERSLQYYNQLWNLQTHQTYTNYEVSEISWQYCPSSG